MGPFSTTRLPKTVKSTAIIRFQDCDPFNHLNNGRYLDYFMNHREDMLKEHYQLDIYRIASESGISWVSTSNQIAYLRPAFLMENVHIESQLLSYNESELLVEMRMFNENTAELKAVIWCGFTHFDLLKQRRAHHSDDLMKFFNEIHLPVDATTFEKRILDIKRRNT